MRHLHAIERGISYVEAHLDEDFALTRVSRAAGMSHFHFQRMFKALTGETIARYVRCRRLARAADALLSTDLRVLDIALDSGFDAQASFTRAFKRAFGAPPATFRRQGQAPVFLRRVELDRAYLSHLHTGVSKEPTLVERSGVSAAGMRTRFFGPESDSFNLGNQIVDVWDTFMPHAATVVVPQNPNFFGIIAVADAQTGELEYTACVELSGESPAPTSMVERRLAAGLYAIFEHRGQTRSLIHTVNYIYGNWLLDSGYQHTYGPDVEIYDERFIQDSDDSMFLYAVPVKRTRAA